MRRLAIAGLALTACRPSATTPADAGVPAPIASASSVVDGSRLPSCTLAPDDGDSTLCGVIEVGEAISVGGPVPLELAVGTITATSSGRSAGVIRFGKGRPVTTTLGEACAGGEPPQLFTRGGELFAAACRRPDRRTPAAAEPSLAIFAVKGSRGEHLLDLPGSPETFDVIGAPDGDAAIGALAVSEDAPPPPAPTGAPGGLKIVSLASDLRGVIASHAIPGSAGAVEARLSPRSSGFWLTWMASRPEHAVPIGSGELEAPSEERGFAWVDTVLLDVAGVPTGSAHHLTAVSGHAAGYGVWAHGDGLDVIVAGDGIWHGREGGALQRVTVRPDGTFESKVIAEGTERGTPPTVVAASPALAWVTYVDVDGDTRLISLTGSPGAPLQATAEPALATARLLAAGAAGGSSRFTLAATSPGPGVDGSPACPWRLRRAACMPLVGGD